MKRWLMVGIPLLILVGLLFVKPPAFTGNKSPALPATTSQPGAKPVIPGSGDEDGDKPSYGGHEADEYGVTPKK